MSEPTATELRILSDVIFQCQVNLMRDLIRQMWCKGVKPNNPWIESTPEQDESLVNFVLWCSLLDRVKDK